MMNYHDNNSQRDLNFPSPPLFFSFVSSVWLIRWHHPITAPFLFVATNERAHWSSSKSRHSPVILLYTYLQFFPGRKQIMKTEFTLSYISHRVRACESIQWVCASCACTTTTTKKQTKNPKKKITTCKTSLHRTIKISAHVFFSLTPQVCSISPIGWWRLTTIRAALFRFHPSRISIRIKSLVYNIPPPSSHRIDTLQQCIIRIYILNIYMYAYHMYLLCWVYTITECVFLLFLYVFFSTQS